MTAFVLALAVLAAVVVLVRSALLRAESLPRNHEPFDGALYRVGEAAVSDRRVTEPRATVIAIHGFVEDMRYFARLYADPSIQLVALTSCGYHVPVRGAVLEEAAWARAPGAPFGTIAYDAAVLVQALEHLPRSKAVRVHGHSRGGAVVLEASAARPDLFADVEVVLEAPVLPQARLYTRASAIALWLYPFLVSLWKRFPFAPAFRSAFGSLGDARKRELLSGLAHNPKRISTFVTNVRDIQRWMAERGHSMFAHVRRGVVLVPGEDRVLDAVSMQDSAKHAEPALEVLRVEGASHFVTLDRPEAIPAVGRQLAETDGSYESAPPRAGNSQ